MTDKRVPTGVFVEADEAKQAIQLFGEYHDTTDDNERLKRKDRLNTYLKFLATKYAYEWSEHEIAPNGEVIRVVKDKQPEGVG